ncbi:MAG: FAD-dependent oxidoreductase [Eubacteriales bacterium]|nr:FAD-dependent oxidoreductase [Eubacteriales bacterium]
MIRIQQLKLPLNYSREDLYKSAAKELRISPAKIQELIIQKRSIDARKKPDIYYILSVDVKISGEDIVLRKNRSNRVSKAETVSYKYPEPGTRQLSNRPIIIGCGPAGLFCGLLLARCGYRPVILERGEDVDTRTASVQKFWETGKLNTSSNVQFGEGGAGTFSDGKLNTMVNDRQGRNSFVLNTFVDAGADQEILYANKPHIGTDVLCTVVKNIRREIESLGGEVHFDSTVTDIFIKNSQVKGVEINGKEQMDCQILVCAVGHSARDTFQMLLRNKIPMEPKAFAVGVRIEHPQEMINISQYGEGYAKVLPPSDYKLTGKLENGRGVYSFCMCPGGYVVNASSEDGMIAVNGMSFHDRGSKNANSAIVVTVTPADFGSSDLLAGVEFQRRLEKYAYRCGDKVIPLQLFGDFCGNRRSTSLGDVEPCIKGAYQLTNLREGLPAFLSESLEAGINMFDKKIRGFSRKDALLCGVESRTSSPVRILRDGERLSSVEGFYPCGEGAGYAGGITSAAMDGMKTAEAIISAYRKI